MYLRLAALIDHLPNHTHVHHAFIFRDYWVWAMAVVGTCVVWVVPGGGEKEEEEEDGIQINKGVCHTVALPFTLKKYLKAKKEELWKLKYFQPCKKYNLQKNFL
jgi:hypothetical protein